MLALREERIRILIVQTAFVGDIILTTPLISALKAIYPGSYLALLTTPAGKEALSGLKELDEIISYDKRKTEKGICGFFRKVKQIRKRKFDLALSPHRSFRTALILAFSGIPVLVGFKESSLRWIYHFRIPRQRELHEVERNLKLLDPVSDLPDGFDAKVKLPVPENFDLSKFGIKTFDNPLIGFAPGSAWETKRLPAEKYAQLAQMLIKELGAKILLLGDAQDQGVCEKIEKLAGVPLLNLCAKTTLPELMGIISKLDLLVSNDSAPVHIGSAFSIPSVVIFGPTVPEFGFGPYKNPHRIVQKQLACRPCHHHGPRKCPEGHFKCMMEIKAEEIFSSAKELLRERRPRNSG